MRAKLAYWSLMVLAFLALALSVTGIVLHDQNMTLQLEVAQRQQQIETGQNMARLLQGIAQHLASAAIDRDDAEIKALLAAEGVKLPPAAAQEKTAPNKISKTEPQRNK